MAKVTITIEDGAPGNMRLSADFGEALDEKSAAQECGWVALDAIERHAKQNFGADAEYSASPEAVRQLRAQQQSH